MKKLLQGGLTMVAAIGMTIGLMSSAASAPLSAREDMAAAAGINVQTAGAVGDGAHRDTQAVQSAIDRAVSEASASVYFPNGTYRVSGYLTVPEQAELIFAAQATLLLDHDAVVTYNGTLTAGDHTVFSGKGRVVGKPMTVTGNPLWFGAKGDGKTDDTAAFQQAIDLFGHVVIPYREAGYVISDLQLSQRQSKLQGESEQRKAKLIAAPTTDKMVTVSNSQIDLEYLSFDMAAAPKATCLYYDDSRMGIELCNARYIDTVDAYCVLADADHPTNMVVTSKFENFHCVDGKGTAVVMKDMWGFIFMTNAVLDYSNSAAKHGIEVNFPGFFLKENAGGIFTDIRVIGDPKGTDKAHAFEVQPGAAMWFRRCVAENCSGNGFAINGGSWAYILECSVKNSQKAAISLKNCNYLQLIDTKVEFTADNKNNGVEFSNGSYNQVQQLSVVGAGKNGLAIQGTTRTTCQNISVSGCGGFGVYDKGTFCSFVGISGENNTGSLINDSSRVY